MTKIKGKYEQYSCDFCEDQEDPRQMFACEESWERLEDGRDRCVTCLIKLKNRNQKLWDLCKELIEAHQISDAEQIVLHDTHLEHGMALIADICDIVGWYKEKP